jgi:hypothetical protein
MRTRVGQTPVWYSRQAAGATSSVGSRVGLPCNQEAAEVSGIKRRVACDPCRVSPTWNIVILDNAQLPFVQTRQSINSSEQSSMLAHRAFALQELCSTLIANRWTFET